MIIWACLIIPFAASAILYFGWKHRVEAWEIILPFAASVIFILISKYTIEHFQVSDTEFWTGYITKTEYYEPWTEQYTVVVTTTDSKGQAHSHTETRIRHHPAEYYIIDNNDIKLGVSAGEYRRLVNKFGFGEVKKDLHHFGQISFGDGDMFYCNYPNDRSKMEVCTTTHSYENRVKASKSVFNFEKIKNPEALGLYSYPKITGYNAVPSILNYTGIDSLAADFELCKRNAELGRAKEVRMWILLFKDKSIATALQQQAYWVNGNKNDFVLCVGCNHTGEVDWAYSFSWCENERLKTDVKNFAQNQTKLDLMSIVKYMSNQVQEHFQRKHFEDFNYLTVEPPTWAITLTFCLVGLMNFGLGVWIVQNDHGIHPCCLPMSRHNPFLQKTSKWGKR